VLEDGDGAEPPTRNVPIASVMDKKAVPLYASFMECCSAIQHVAHGPARPPDLSSKKN